MTFLLDNPKLPPLAPGEKLDFSAVFHDSPADAVPLKLRKDGKLRIVFHAHNSTTTIHPRYMYISTVSFENKGGKDIMVADKNYNIPTWINK